jgi:para-aminobenzoate synthetase/4-amino-4-deoxychorismate lyase
MDNQLITPPLACGVLAGTFRAHLLETGQIVEKTIAVELLPRAKKIFRINSVRKWQRVEILQ